MKAINAILMSVVFVFRVVITAFAVSLVVGHPGVTLKDLFINVVIVFLVDLYSYRDTDIKQFLEWTNIRQFVIFYTVFLGVLLLIYILFF